MKEFDGGFYMTFEAKGSHRYRAGTTTVLATTALVAGAYLVMSGTTARAEVGLVSNETHKADKAIEAGASSNEARKGGKLIDAGASSNEASKKGKLIEAGASSNDLESQTMWCVAADNRVGPVGRFLRSTSIDELPQLWNILRGDMTLVGPRPERPHFVEQFSTQFDRYGHRHRVQVGLTGFAQVSGLRGDTSIADRARYDNFYIENWSLWLDIKIIFRTFREVMFYRGR